MEWPKDRNTERQKDRNTERLKDRKTERDKGRRTERQKTLTLTNWFQKQVVIDAQI